MNKVMKKNLKAATMEQVAVIHTVGKSKPQTVAMVYVEKDLNVQQKAEIAFMATQSIKDAWWNNDNVVPIFDNGDTVRSTVYGDQILVGNEKYEWVDKDSTPLVKRII